MHTEEQEAGNSLHCHPVNKDGFVDSWLSLADVNNQLLGLVSIEKKTVDPVPFNQIMNLPSVL